MSDIRECLKRQKQHIAEASVSPAQRVIYAFRNGIQLFVRDSSSREAQANKWIDDYLKKVEGILKKLGITYKVEKRNYNRDRTSTRTTQNLMFSEKLDTAGDTAVSLKRELDKYHKPRKGVAVEIRY